MTQSTFPSGDENVVFETIYLLLVMCIHVDNAQHINCNMRLLFLNKWWCFHCTSWWQWSQASASFGKGCVLGNAIVIWHFVFADAFGSSKAVCWKTSGKSWFLWHSSLCLCEYNTHIIMNVCTDYFSYPLCLVCHITAFLIDFFLEIYPNKLNFMFGICPQKLNYLYVLWCIFNFTLQMLIM
jgi:hypothetical protein